MAFNYPLFCKFCDEIACGTTRSCKLLLCINCLSDYVDMELRKGVKTIKCPREDCLEELEPDYYFLMVHPTIIYRWKNPRKLSEDVGQSSKVVPMNDTFYCSICTDNVPISDTFVAKGCSHRFCAGCVKQYIEIKVKENRTDIRCPDPKCKRGIFEPEMFEKILPMDVLDNWCIALCESSLGSKRFHCPFNDCQALLIFDVHSYNTASVQTTRKPQKSLWKKLGFFCHAEKIEEPTTGITMSECPHCNRLFCANCQVTWHNGMTCNQFQNRNKERDDYANLQKLAEEKKWQKCPHCKTFVERKSGCKMMTCRCGHFFCYICGAEMKKNNHFCPKCKS
ncbi:hypothetical protein LUZ60_002948 [Juncus effusus]|nr:hypothetical protein LUZ60_002948 [Juncus effusus]